METEIEAKFLDVEHDSIRAKLREIGAICEQPMRLMRRKTYDFPDGRLSAIKGWVRLRDEGDKVTMSYKQMNDRTLHGTKEVCIVVDDFAAADQLLLAIGLRQKSYHETKRESWELDGVQIELDEWPWIKPFLEIEGPGEGAVKAVASRLGLDWSNAIFGGAETAYWVEYEVTEDEVIGWKEITFAPVPEWLESKRKTRAVA